MDPCMRQQYLLCLQQQQQQLLEQHQQQQQQQMRHRGSPHAQGPYPNPVSPLHSPTYLRGLHQHRQATKAGLPHNSSHSPHNPQLGSPTGSPSQSVNASPLPPNSQPHPLHPGHFSPPLTPQQQNSTPSQQQQQSQLSPPVPQVHITNCDDPITQVGHSLCPFMASPSVFT